MKSNFRDTVNKDNRRSVKLLQDTAKVVVDYCKQTNTNVQAYINAIVKEKVQDDLKNLKEQKILDQFNALTEEDKKQIILDMIRKGGLNRDQY